MKDAHISWAVQDSNRLRKAPEWMRTNDKDKHEKETRQFELGQAGTFSQPPDKTRNGFKKTDRAVNVPYHLIPCAPKCAFLIPVASASVRAYPQVDDIRTAAKCDHR